MLIESVEQSEGCITVITTGGRFEIDTLAERGLITCSQRINRERIVATVRLGHPLQTVSIEHQDDEFVVLNQIVRSTWYARLIIRGDSVLELYSMPELTVDISGQFAPAYTAQHNQHVLLLDEVGGLGVYDGAVFRLQDADKLSSTNWHLHYQGEQFCRLYVAVLPPKPFDWQRSFDDRIAHWGVNPPWTFGHAPDDAMIAEAAQYANILVLHDQIWHGKLTRRGIEPATEHELEQDAAYCSYDFAPFDAAVLHHVVEVAHQHGMRVLPYFSPTFASSSGEHFLPLVMARVEEFGFDGVYFDGTTFDLTQAYTLMRQARRLLGDKLIELHSTWEPLMSRNCYCPFIDAYADFILRGEHPADFDAPDYLRYVLAGYNTSNSIGLLCHCYYPPEFIERIIDTTMAFNGRFYWALPETANEAVLTERYLPALQAARERYQQS